MEYLGDALEVLKKIWYLLVLIAGGVAGFFRWKETRRKSTNLLFEELEKLKQRVILQISKEIEHATELSEKNRLLLALKEHCPDCYDTVIKKIKEDAESN